MSRSVHVPLWLLLAACGAEGVSDSNDLSDSRTTMLITGDRVSLPPGGGAPRVIPAPGREGIGYFSVRAGDHAAVIPKDMMERVARGELSPSLFEIGAPANVDEPDPEKLVDLHFLPLDSAGNPAIGSGVLFGGPRGFQFIHYDDVVPVVQNQRYETFFVGFTESMMLVQPIVILEENTDLVLDGRLAKVADVSVPGQPLDFGDTSQILYVNRNGASGGTSTVSGGGFGLIATAQFGPPPAPGDVVSLATIEATGRNDHESYVFAHRQDGFMTGFTLAGTPDRLITVNTKVRATATQVHEKHTFATLLDLDLTTNDPAARFQAQGPFERTEHFVNDAGITWVPELALLDDEGFAASRLGRVPVAYRPGRTVDELWNRAPFGPAFSVSGDAFDNGPMASRNGDELRVAPSLFSDVAAPSRIGVSRGTLHVALFRNGELVDETGEDDTFELFFPVQVPAGDAAYRLEAEGQRDASVSPLSSHVTAAWTFRSAHTSGLQVLPLPTMRFAPLLDRNNASIAGLPLVLPVHIERLPGAPTPAIRSINVEASFDDGATWHAVPGARLGAEFVGIVLPPARASFVSLRGNASDVAGNRVEQTIIRATALTPLRR